jgi:hypothetical protein
MKSPVLLYADKPQYSRWLRCIFIGMPLMLIITGLAVISLDITATTNYQ